MTDSVKWKDGGSERFVWSTDNRHNWAAVWKRECFVGWVSGPCIGQRVRLVSHHPTEAEAKDWCEARMREEAESK
jgi:hypothetical protein